MSSVLAEEPASKARRLPSGENDVSRKSLMPSMAGASFPVRSIHTRRRPPSSPSRNASTPFLDTENDARPTASTPRPSPIGVASPSTFTVPALNFCATSVFSRTNRR